LNSLLAFAPQGRDWTENSFQLTSALFGFGDQPRFSDAIHDNLYLRKPETTIVLGEDQCVFDATLLESLSGIAVSTINLGIVVDQS
jgi:hypothetical protein